MRPRVQRPTPTFYDENLRKGEHSPLSLTSHQSLVGRRAEAKKPRTRSGFHSASSDTTRRVTRAVRRTGRQPKNKNLAVFVPRSVLLVSHDAIFVRMPDVLQRTDESTLFTANVVPSGCCFAGPDTDAGCLSWTLHA